MIFPFTSRPPSLLPLGQERSNAQRDQDEVEHDLNGVRGCLNDVDLSEVSAQQHEAEHEEQEAPDEFPVALRHVTTTSPGGVTDSGLVTLEN